MDAGRLPDATHLGRVRLRVADLSRSLALYEEVLGLQAIPQEAAVSLSTGDARELIRLEEQPGAPPAPSGSTGLYHFALRVPDRGALARTLVQLRDASWPIRGLSDHAVSEAIYLADPDGNGIEIYADRPRDRWTRRANGELQMTTKALDLQGLLSELGPGSWHGLPAGTTVGHIHLQVSDLEAAETFYQDLLGFDVAVRSYPGALFFSAGGYHHHIGTNIWESAGGTAPPAGAAGLIDYEIMVGESRAAEAALNRLRQEGHGPTELDGGWSVEDPDGITAVLRA